MAGGNLSYTFEYAHRLNDKLLLFRNSLIYNFFLLLLTFRPRLKPSSVRSV